MMGRGRGRGPDRDPSGETDDVGGVGRVGLGGLGGLGGEKRWSRMMGLRKRKYQTQYV